MRVLLGLREVIMTHAVRSKLYKFNGQTYDRHHSSARKNPMFLQAVDSGQSKVFFILIFFYTRAMACRTAGTAVQNIRARYHSPSLTQEIDSTP